MDRTTAIEQKIAEAISAINRRAVGGYTEYTATGQVDIYDMALSTSLNESTSGGTITDIDYVITQVDGEDAGEENEEFGIAQNIYTNTIEYKIAAQIRLSGDETNPLRSMAVKCNEVLSDLKRAFGTDHTLSQSVNWIQYIRSRKEYTENGDIISGCRLITTFQVNYSQQILNPDIIAC